MFELEHNGYYPLTESHLNEYVPARPGIYTLAIRLVNGVHHTFFTTQSDNLYASLRKIADGDHSFLPLSAKTCMERFQPYFTYFVILNGEHQRGIQKMLSHTSDPVLKLKVLNAN